MTPDEFRAESGVSRETLDRLQTYAGLLTRWQGSINLVGAATLPDMWRRHFLDSAQLAGLAPPGAGPWLDLGTGAGFPGMVLAIMEVGEVHLVESDQRKCAFLTEVARVTGAAVHLHRARAEDVSPGDAGVAGVVTARAVAPLAGVLELAEPFTGPGTIILLPAGRAPVAALTEARKSWMMQAETLPSRTAPDASILRLREVFRGRSVAG